MTGRVWACVAGLLVAGAVAASPVPRTPPKGAAFPAGRYVLAGGPEAAQGGDVREMTGTFSLRTGQYVLSGGPSPDDDIKVDDDLEVRQGDAVLFVDDDGLVSTERRGKNAAHYQGQPIVLVLDPLKKLRVRVTDRQAAEAGVSELWLHRFDGARVRLTKEITRASAAELPHTFFDESYDLTVGFEVPRGLKFDAKTEMPEKPASLVARFQTRR